MDATLFVNLTQRAARTAISGVQVPVLLARLQTQLVVTVYFFAEGSPAALLTGSPTFRFALKSAATGTSLAFSSTATATATGYKFTIDSLDSAALRTAIGDQPELDCTAELEWTRSAVVERVSFPCAVGQAYIRSTDAAPDPNDDATDAWLASKLAAGSNITLSVHPTTGVITIAAAGGAGSGDALVANNLDQFASVTQTAGQTLAITSSTTLAGGTHSGTNTGDQTNITGNAATVTTNANLTGPVTSTGNATAIANGAITNAMLANAAVANLSGTNTGDQSLAAYLTSTLASTTYQPLDADLTRLATLSTSSMTGGSFAMSPTSQLFLLAGNSMFDGDATTAPGGSPGTVTSIGGNGYAESGSGYPGGDAGGISMGGGSAALGFNGGTGGNINTSGSGTYSGGNLNLNSTGTISAGSVTTSAGGSLTMGTANIAGGNIAGTILTTAGSAASLTDFPTLNQNTTGSAATLTTARTINGTSFNGSANITVTAAGSTLSDTVPTTKGGTGLTALGTALQVLRTNAGATALEFATLPGGGNAQTADPLSQFAATTSAQLAGVMSDETGSGALVFATSPTLVTPALGTPSSGNLASCTALPVSGITGSTSTALGVGSLEIGHASDTTLARLSAGNVGVEGNLLFRAGGSFVGLPVEIQLACSDETTACTTGTAKVTFRMPYAMTLTAVRASVTTAPTGSTFVIDINETATTILSTKLSIDASEKTSTTAATAAVISDSALADDAEITIDFDQIGSTIAGAGVKVTLIGTRA